MPAPGSPFAREIRRRAAAHRHAALTARSPAHAEEIVATFDPLGLSDRRRGTWSRRDFLKGAAAGAGVLALGASGRRASAEARDDPTVVIVGAGLAGLSCAYELARHGVAATVYEARERLGGRCWTLRGFFENDQTGEHHGQYIDSRHVQLLRLAAQLDIHLIDTFEQSFPAGSRGLLWLNGRDRNPDEVFADFGVFLDRLSHDYGRVGSYVCHEAGPRALAFDRMSMREWFDQRLPGGSRSLLGRALTVFESGFFGIDTEGMSAINLFEAFLVYEGADERYRLKGGNDRLVSALAEQLPARSIRTRSPLEAIWSTNDGRVGLRFSGSARDVIADRVVLALPFRTLREVDTDGLELSRRKRRAVETLAMGTNSKIHMQLDRTFATLDWNADFVSDAPRYVTWDSTYGQTAPAPRTPVLTYWNGGRAGTSWPTQRGHGPAPPAVVGSVLDALGRGVHGIRRAYNGRAYLDSPVHDPWMRGSYAGFAPGQYTDFWGCLGDREGPVHFAGEHTSTHSQGYLNGGVESGQRAAQELLRLLT